MKNNIEIVPAEEYKWNDNFRDPIAHTDIKPIIEELKVILDVRGKVTPAYVVESAKRKNSPLHGYFEWDNEKAAESWRIRQAAKLLGHIEIKIIKNGEPRCVRVYQLTKYNDESGGGEFQNIKSLSGPNIDFMKRMIIADLKRIENKLSAFDDFASVVSYIVLAIGELEKPPQPPIITSGNKTELAAV